MAYRNCYVLSAGSIPRRRRVCELFLLFGVISIFLEAVAPAEVFLHHARRSVHATSDWVQLRKFSKTLQRTFLLTQIPALQPHTALEGVAEPHLPCGCGKSDRQIPPKDEGLLFGGADICLLATGAEQRG